MTPRDVGPRRPIDWADVRERLRAAQRGVQAGAALDPAAAARVLEARARELARPGDAAGPDHAVLSLVAFALGSELYAVDARGVRGVFRLTDLAPLPGAGPHTAGVTLWRGELLVVFDLRQVLGLGATGLDDRAWVVAIGDHGQARGLLAGTLQDLVRVPEPDLRPPKRDEDGTTPRFLRGITPQAIQVLDAAALLQLET